MLLKQIALVSQTAGVDASELAIVSAALQKQVTRDFSPIWNVSATVDSFPRLEDVPPGYHHVIVRDDVQKSTGAKGVHRGPENTAFALVQYTGDDTWSIHASHETLEMLADPSLNRLVPSASIKPDQGRVEYLLEVCDPCQDPSLSYTVNGVRVCDFHTPQFFDPVRAPGVRYSFAGSLTAPRQVREGGYLAWVVPDTGEWWMGAMFEGEMIFARAAPPGADLSGLSNREFIDSVSEQPREMRARAAVRADYAASGSAARAAMRQASELGAKRLEATIAYLLKSKTETKTKTARTGRGSRTGSGARGRRS